MEVVVGKARMSRKEKAERIVEMYEAGYSYKEICEALRVAPQTIAKVLREAEEGSKRPEIGECLRDLESRVKRLEEGESRVLKLEKDLKRMEQRYEKMKDKLKEVIRAVNNLYGGVSFV